MNKTDYQAENNKSNSLIKSLMQQFEAIVESNPNKSAVINNELTLTYCELNEKANELALTLEKQGIHSTDLVAIMLNRSFEMIIGIVAILKLGAAYIPIDPAYPNIRVEHILKHSEAKIILTETAYINRLCVLKESLERTVEVVNLEKSFTGFKVSADCINGRLISSNNLAYIMFTSGSTGTPKGVAVTHRNINNYIHWFALQFELNKESSIDFSTSFSFDFSVTSTLAPLLHGAAIIICSEDIKYSPLQYLHYLKRHNITHVKWTPSYLNCLLYFPNEIAVLSDLRWIILGGEALSLNDIKKWFSFYSKAAIVNEYGPTEATVATIAHIVTEKTVYQYSKTVPLGIPANNTQIYIVDTNGQLCSPNEPGELWIGGESVADGYFKQPQLTEERFIPNPFSDVLDDRIYKTGDIAYRSSSGLIEYLGRIDEQIKIRGFRIELGEIEAILTSYPYVHQAAVITRDTYTASPVILAYVVPRVASFKIDISALQRFLQEQLPSYMLPTNIIQISKIPLSSHGKIDKKSLPEPISEINKSTVKPRNETETYVIQLLSKLLKHPVTEISIYDNFFEMGGDSLLAMWFIAECNKHFQKEISIRLLFESEHVADFSAKLLAEAINIKYPEIKALSALEQQLLHPLSYAQERLWFLDQLEPDSALYNVFFALQLDGKLHVKALKAAFLELFNRHASLRTSFIINQGKVYQKIFSMASLTFDLKAEDFQDKSIDLIELQAHIEAQTPFDLTKAPLLKVRLLQHNKYCHFLLVCLHHIIVDGWSIHLLLSELTQIYKSFCEGQSYIIPPRLQYFDFACWQKNYLTESILEPLVSFWKKELCHLPQFTLSVEHVSAEQVAYKGKRSSFRLGKQLTQALKCLSREAGTTLFTTLLTGFSILLARYSQQEDIVIGTPTAGRNVSGIDHIVGFFVNLLVLRNNLSENPDVLTLLARNKEMTIAAYENQALPFEKLVEVINPPREIGRNPLCQVLFVFQNYPDPPFNFKDLKTARVFSDNQLLLFSDYESSKFDLTLFLQEQTGYLDGLIEYNCDRFHKKSILNLIQHLKIILISITKNPHQRVWNMPLLTLKEQKKLINSYFNIPSTVENHSLMMRFERQVHISPDNFAIRFDSETLTYHELNYRSNQVAHYLRAQGVGSQTVVAVCLNSGIEAIVALLAIFKTGGVYLSIDSEYPLERINFMLYDSGSTFLLTQVNLGHLFVLTEYHNLKIFHWESDIAEPITQFSIEKLPEHQDNQELIAYLVYTSGTSGKPKGIAVKQKTLSNLIDWQSQQANKKNRNITQFSSLGFDVFLQETFFTLLNGYTLHIVPAAIKHDIRSFLEFLISYSIHQIFIPTIMLDILVKEALLRNKKIPNLEEIIVAGEQLVINHSIKEFFNQNKQIRLINHYGPSETHVVTSYSMPNNQAIWAELPPIGKPIANTSVEHKQILPTGVIGEIYISGFGLADCYLNNKELTKQKFIIHSFDELPEMRLYKTGDRGYWSFDGNLHYTGRMDEQIKIRGFRIELGEIESVLIQHPCVEQTSVLLNNKHKKIDKYLTAYIILKTSNYAIKANEFYDFLKNHLPAYMIPRQFIVVEQFPLTAHGKIDKKELSRIKGVILSLSIQKKEVYTPIQKLLQQLISDSLNISMTNIGLTDNFFDLGLYSLLAIELCSKINTALGTVIVVRNLFESPNLAQLSQVVEHYLSKKIPAPTISIEYLVPIVNQYLSPYLFLIHPLVGLITDYFGLKKYWHKPMSIYAIQDPSFEKRQFIFNSLQEMAKTYLGEIQKIQPKGPYYLGGYSMGGVVAIEIARQLSEQKETIQWVGLIDSWAISVDHPKHINYFKQRITKEYASLKNRLNAANEETMILLNLFQHHVKLLTELKIAQLPFSVILFKAEDSVDGDYPEGSEVNFWDLYSKLPIKIYPIPGDHKTIFDQKNIKTLAGQLEASII